MGGLFLLILVVVIVKVYKTLQNRMVLTEQRGNKYEETSSIFVYMDTNCKNIPLTGLKLYSKNDTVNLFGHNITNSIFYVCNSKSDMPFVISLKSSPVFEKTSMESLGYWSNYNELSKIQQGYYIKWLSEGKPYINELGYAYIYYYGLEYRSLVEKKDLKEVLFEVIDLVSKFEKLSYGYKLITYLVLCIKNFTVDEIDKLLIFYHNHKEHYMYNFTDSVSIFNAILHKLTPLDKNNIDFSALYSDLYFCIDNDTIQTSLSSRKYELLSYYMDKMVGEINITDTYSVVSRNYNYYMAMWGYRAPNTIKYEAIIPSKQLKYLWNNARKLIVDGIEQTVKKFDSSAEPLTEIEKLAYLPSELRKNIKYSIDNFDFGEKKISDIDTIASKLGFKIQDKATLRQSTLLVNACEAFGYEIEPDANIDQKPYKKNTKVLIYKNPYSEKVSSVDYQIVSLFTDLGYLIALEDKELLQVEVAYLENYIKNEFHLSQSEIYRMQMRGELLVNTKEISSGEIIKKLIKMLNNDSKETIAKYMVSVAITDGVVKDSELKILQKIFNQLEFSEDYLNSTLSELLESTDEVVVIEKGTKTKKKGSKIPTNIETNEKIELKLDTEKLEKIKINTSEVQNVLQEIFADEQVDVLQSEPKEILLPDNKNKLEIEDGLQNIVNVFIEKGNLTRNELLNIIQTKGMMLNSIIDKINEWSEDKFGDFLIEEDADVYKVNEDVVNLIRDI